MTVFDWIACIGAGAWIPVVARGIHAATVRASVLIVPDARAEVGFTTFGPMLNLRIAFSASKKDVLLARLGFMLEHQDGDRHDFTWVGMNENLGEISDLAGNRQFIQKEQSAIAIRLPTDALVERFVRFHDERFRSESTIVFNQFGAHV